MPSTWLCYSKLCTKLSNQMDTDLMFLLPCQSPLNFFLVILCLTWQGWTKGSAWHSQQDLSPLQNFFNLELQGPGGRVQKHRQTSNLFVLSCEFEENWSKNRSKTRSANRDWMCGGWSNGISTCFHCFAWKLWNVLRRHRVSLSHTPAASTSITWYH